MLFLFINYNTPPPPPSLIRLILMQYRQDVLRCIILQ